MITTQTLIIAAALVALILLTTVALLWRYRRCPTDKLLIVYGKNKTRTIEETYKDAEGNPKTRKVTVQIPAKIIHGGGTFVIPVIQDYAEMALMPYQLSKKVEGVSSQMIKTFVSIELSVGIGSTDELRTNAASRFMSASEKDIKAAIEAIYVGEVRSLMARMTIEELNSDREAFLTEAKKNIEIELQKIGFTILNINISDLDDAANYINNLGQNAAEQASATAKAAIANQRKIGEVNIANTEKEKAIQLATAEKEKQIEVANQTRDRETTVAKTQQEQAVTIAQIEKEQQTNIADTQKQKEVQLSEIEKDKQTGIALQKAEQAANVANARASEIAQVAAATALAESKKAEANATQQENVANAQTKGAMAQAKAEAEKVKALAAAKAEAESAKAQREAEQIKAQETARADADATTNEQKALKETRIATANQEKEAQIAKATEDKAARQAEYTSERQIRAAVASQNAGVAEQNAKVAVAEARGKAGEAVAAANKKVALADIEADMTAKQEMQVRQQQVNEAEAKAVEAKLNAEQIVPKQKEREVIVIEADAIKQRAILEAQGEAEKIRQAAQAEADRIRMTTEAEAAGIAAKGRAAAEAEELMVLAKAKGIQQEALAPAMALERMAEAFGGDVHSLVQYEFTKHIESVAGAQAKVFENFKVDNVSVYGNKDTLPEFLTTILRNVVPAFDVITNGLNKQVKDILDKKEESSKNEDTPVESFEEVK